MLSFFQQGTALETQIFFFQLDNPSVDAVNKKSKEECVDHLAGSIWFAN